MLSITVLLSMFDIATSSDAEVELKGLNVTPSSISVERQPRNEALMLLKGGEEGGGGPRLFSSSLVLASRKVVVELCSRMARGARSRKKGALTTHTFCEGPESNAYTPTYCLYCLTHT